MGIAIIVPGADYRDKNLGQVTPTETLHIQALAIVGPSNVFVSGQFNVYFVPTFTTERSVIWSIVAGNEYATIDNNGNLTVAPDTPQQTITIRCTSSVDAAVYAEKSVVVSSTALQFFDWVTSDGTDVIYHPGLLDIWQAKVILRCTHDGANTYVMGCFYAANSTQARIAAYNNASNKVSAYTGTGGGDNFVTKTEGMRYRYEWNCGTAGASSNDSSFFLYNDETDEQLGVTQNVRFEMSGRIGLFRYSIGAPDSGVWDDVTNLTPNGAKLYEMKVVRNSDDAVLLHLKPASYNGVAGVYDLATNTFWPGIVNEGGITVGND